MKSEPVQKIHPKESSVLVKVLKVVLRVTVVATLAGHLATTYQFKDEVCHKFNMYLNVGSRASALAPECKHVVTPHQFIAKWVSWTEIPGRVVACSHAPTHLSQMSLLLALDVPDTGASVEVMLKTLENHYHIANLFKGTHTCGESHPKGRQQRSMTLS